MHMSGPLFVCRQCQSCPFLATALLPAYISPIRPAYLQPLYLVVITLYSTDSRHRTHRAMSPEIKFSSWGIPYIVEFANVRFRRKLKQKRKSMCPPPLPPKDARYLYASPSANDSDWTFASNSSMTLHNEYPVVGKEESEGRVLYIRFASEGLTAIPGPALSSRRLHTLGRRIAGALVAVGMIPSPASERVNSNGSITKRASMPASAGSLYRGTYGQVVSALKSAGLTSTLCEEGAVPGATHLGVMFVLRDTHRGEVELTKLNLMC